MANWLHAVRQSTTYLGVAVIVIIWGGIYLLAGQEHESAYQDAVRQGGNLALVLEQYVRRVVQQSDSSLLELRRAYQRNPQDFNIVDWVVRTQSHNNLTAHFGIAGADGFVKQSSSGPLKAPVYVGDRVPFVVQRDNATDDLYMSDPVIGQVTKRVTIEFTRRLSNPDGSFAGTVVCSLDIARLEKFFSSLDIGKSGVVFLAGRDRVLLARGGPDPATQGFAGMTIARSLLYRAAEQSPSGHYWNSQASSMHFDGVSRLISYRTVSGIPVIAAVGLAEQNIFQHATATLHKYLVVGGVLTLIVLIVMAFGARQRKHILATAAELQELEAIGRAVEPVAAHRAQEHGARPMHVRSRSAARHLQRALWRDVRSRRGPDQARHDAAFHP